MGASEGGFRAYSSAGVGAGSAPVFPYKIASAVATDIFQGDLVKMVAATGSVIAMAAVSDIAIAGVFVGCEFTDSNGQRQQSNKYVDTITRDDTIAYVLCNPHQIWKIRIADGSDADTTLTRAAVGLKYDIEFNAGNSTTGHSGMCLDQSQAGDAGDANMTLIGLTNDDGTNDAIGAAAKTFTHGLVIIDPDISIYGSSVGI